MRRQEKTVKKKQQAFSDFFTTYLKLSVEDRVILWPELQRLREEWQQAVKKTGNHISN